MRKMNGMALPAVAAALSMTAGQALACDQCVADPADVTLTGADYRVIDLNGCRGATAAEAANIAQIFNGGTPGNEFEVERDRVMASVNQFENGRSGFDIQFALSPAVANDPDFPGALELAAQLWESVIHDNATVVIDVDFVQNQGFLAAAGSDRASISYANLVGVLQGDASAAEQTYLNALPGVLEFDYGNVFNTNDSYSFGQLNIVNPVATYQGLGFGDVNGGQVESSIVFNTDFTWDPDPFDGFQGQASIYYVMVHEIGHAIGFVSGTDSSTFPSILDVFRVGALNSPQNPNNLSQFATVQRQMEQGVEAQLDPLNQFPGFNTELRFSTGTNGDGRQASHWKDQSALGQSQVIGVMDPTFEGGAGIDLTDPLSDNDLLAFSLIGWDIVIPGSNTNPPDAFALLSPNDGATGVTDPPTFSWEVAGNADDYTLIVTPDGGGTPVISTTVNNTSFTPNAGLLQPGVTYGWIVNANNPFGNTGATGGSDFFTMADVPGEFALLSPIDNATDVVDPPTFDWEDAANVVDYTLRVFPDGSSTAVIDETLVTSEFTPSAGILQDGVTYRWIVLAENAVGTRPATGGLDFFTMEQPAPCPDTDGDGLVGTSDLLDLLSEWGQSGPNLTADFDGDDSVGTSDLLVLLGAWGTTCP